jgi:hypothetical protein
MIGVGELRGASHSPQFPPLEAKILELTMVNEKKSAIFAGNYLTTTQPKDTVH